MYKPIRRYPTPHSLSTQGVSGSIARSLRRSREACVSTVRVELAAGHSQTQRRSSARVKTRVGSLARIARSANSRWESRSGMPRSVAFRLTSSIRSSPAKMTLGSSEEAARAAASSGVRRLRRTLERHP